MLLVLALLVGSAVLAGIALDQQQAAEQWRDRALLLEQQRDEALVVADDLDAELDAAGAIIDDAVGRLETSERDVSDLEGRLRALADERARAEDALLLGEAERDVLVELSTRVADAVDTLDVCVDRLLALQEASVEAFNAAATGQDVDVDALNQQADDTARFCTNARTAAAQAGAAADLYLDR